MAEEQRAACWRTPGFRHGVRGEDGLGEGGGGGGGRPLLLPLPHQGERPGEAGDRAEVLPPLQAQHQPGRHEDRTGPKRNRLETNIFNRNKQIHWLSANMRR